MWMMKDPMATEPGLTKSRIPGCQYMHYLDPQGEAAREYADRYVDSEEKPTGSELDDMKKGAIPCWKLKECPNPTQIAKFTRAAMFAKV
jgi:hypothetical protein